MMFGYYEQIENNKELMKIILGLQVTILYNTTLFIHIVYIYVYQYTSKPP